LTLGNEEQQQPHMKGVLVAEALEGPKELENKLCKMITNDVWHLEEIPNEAKTVGCKWVYKT